MLSPGTVLQNRYRILEKVGGGGFGYVYKAIDETFGCCVAIKETKEQVAGLDQLRRAFEREAKLLRNLKHDCLPRVTDYFFHEHAQFLVMDFIEGEDLAARLKRRIGREEPFDVREVLPWADKVLGALEYLHSRPEPIVHRDIKPSNITLTDAGEIYLLDFGLAKGLAGQMSTMLDGEKLLSLAAFTHEYAPLEQVQSTGTEPQSDIYAFGATLYHLLTGHPPISASLRDEAMHREKPDPLRVAHEINPAIPQSISEIISRAMIIRSWDRLGSAKEMRVMLAGASTKVVLPKPDPDVPVASRSESLSHSFGSRPPVERPSAESVQTGPTRAVAGTGLRSRRWIVAGASVVLVMALAIGARIVFPYWFTQSEIQQAATEATLSTVPAKTPVPMTPRNLKPTILRPAHRGTVWSVAYSPDGRFVASAGQDKRILVWNTDNWNEPGKELTEHEGPVYSVAFSPDSKSLASASKDGSIKLWDTTTLEPTPLQIDEKEWPILRVAFSPNGEYLASCAAKYVEKGCEEVRIWEMRDRNPRTLNGTLSQVQAIAFSPDSRRLVTVGTDRQMRFWDVTTGAQGDSLTLDQPLFSVTFFRENGYLACGAGDGTIRLWRQGASNLQSEKTLQAVKEKPRDSINVVVTASPDNLTLASAGPYQEIKLWDITSRTFTTQKTKWSQTSLAFSPDGQKLVSGDYLDGFVRVWQ